MAKTNHTLSTYYIPEKMAYDSVQSNIYMYKYAMQLCNKTPRLSFVIVASNWRTQWTTTFINFPLHMRIFKIRYVILRFCVIKQISWMENLYKKKGNTDYDSCSSLSDLLLSTEAYASVWKIRRTVQILITTTLWYYTYRISWRECRIGTIYSTEIH